MTQNVDYIDLVSDSEYESESISDSEYDSDSISDVDVDPEYNHKIYIATDKDNMLKLGETKDSKNNLIRRYKHSHFEININYLRKTTKDIAKNTETLMKNLLIYYIDGEKIKLNNKIPENLEFLGFLIDIIINNMQMLHKKYKIKLVKHHKRQYFDLTDLSDYFPPDLNENIFNELSNKYIEPEEIDEFIDFELNYLIDHIIKKINT